MDPAVASSSPISAQEKVSAIRAAFPSEGLFADKDWLLSPEAFPIVPETVVQLERLGHRLLLFTRACNLLYHLSVSGRQPRWIADYLDAGKPPELVEYSRRKEFRQDLPRVIRPDVIITEDGFTIAELDSVPGGVGLTGWLNHAYAQIGEPVIGGADGMLDGFASILPAGDIVVSDEAATYKPEMVWLANRLNERAGSTAWQVHAAAGYIPHSSINTPHSVYRFFELFDLPNVPCAGPIMDSATAGELTVTPPFKPYLEEKMWFALFWMRPLREFWRRELGERHWLKLQGLIPYTWIMDPAPLPQHAVIPRLDINDWREMAAFTQKQRDLLIKVSGFSEHAWGSRGIDLGEDMSHRDWKEAIDNALARFATSPSILQRFHKSALVNHRYVDAGSGELRTMRGRVRLCPYYFVSEDKAHLRGILATVCPADKKFIHGMRDAILVPAKTASS